MARGELGIHLAASLAVYSWQRAFPGRLLLALCTVILVGGGREGISRTITANRACRPCLWLSLRLP